MQILTLKVYYLRIHFLGHSAPMYIIHTCNIVRQCLTCNSIRQHVVYVYTL